MLTIVLDGLERQAAQKAVDNMNGLEDAMHVYDGDATPQEAAEWYAAYPRVVAVGTNAVLSFGAACQPELLHQLRETEIELDGDGNEIGGLLDAAERLAKKIEASK